MLEEIRMCKNCNLCKNQKPLLDESRICDVMWVGLSAKIVEDVKKASPLDNTTQSGKVIAEIESMTSNLNFYKTNVVKCAPLDDNGKLRYPNRREMDACIDNLEREISNLNPKVIFLLGTQAKEAVERKYKFKFLKSNDFFQYNAIQVDNLHFFAVEHPSYVVISKRKRINEYKEAILKSIESVM